MLQGEGQAPVAVCKDCGTALVPRVGRQGRQMTRCDACAGAEQRRQSRESKRGARAAAREAADARRAVFLAGCKAHGLEYPPEDCQGCGTSMKHGAGGKCAECRAI